MAPIVNSAAVTSGLAKAASLPSRAYVTFLAGNGDYWKGVVGLVKGLRKVQSAYPLVVACLPDVPEEHRRILVNQGCIIREIEPVYPPENQTEFAMAYYVINYSKLRIWEFVEYSKMIYLDGDIEVASALFRFIGAAGRNMIIANTFGSFSLLMLLTLGGFILSREQIKSWWIWGYWSSTLMYAQTAIIVNEFTGNNWKHILPNSNETLGVSVMKSRGFFTEAHWYWIGVGANLGFLILFNICFAVALTYLKPLEKRQAVIPEDTEKEEERGEESRRERVASGSSSWRYTGKEENMDREDIKMLVKKWWDIYNDESLNYKRPAAANNTAAVGAKT